jgi:hypothetical protein
MGVSGNSVAGKSFQIFTVSEELLAKVTEAVQAGEKAARSSGDIQSFEVFCHGFRANISLGRIMVIPAAVCNDRQNFPTALLHGALVRIFGTGGEEISDLIEKKIGESEFDEYSQADFDSLKNALFVDPKTGKEACLIVFAPNWMNSREYICFHFTKDAAELSNNLRHQVFSAYYNPAVSSAFNALMTNVDTTKVDVTDITPKLSYPFITENPLKEYPRLDKQATYRKETILLNRKTADDVTKQTLEPQELDVFEALDTALSTSMGVDSGSGAQGEGGFTAPEAKPGVPREASAKVAAGISAEAHTDDRAVEVKFDATPWFKQADPEEIISLANAEWGGDYPADEVAIWMSDSNGELADLFKYIEIVNRRKQHETVGFECHVDEAPARQWLAANRPDVQLPGGLGQTASAKVARKAASNDEVITTNPPASHESPFTNVGPGTEAEDEQENTAKAVKESLDDAAKQNEEKATSPIGIAIDENGVPRREDAKAAAKKCTNCKTKLGGPGKSMGCHDCNGEFCSAKCVDAHEAKTKHGKKASAKVSHVDKNGMCPGCKKAGKDCACSGCTCKQAANQPTNIQDPSHPETLLVSSDRLSSIYSAAYNGGFVDRYAMPPQEVRAALEELADNSKPAPHAAQDHAKQIEAGFFGEDPMNRRANEKWGSAELKTAKRSNKEVMASYIADIVATEIDEPSDAMSHKAKQARAKSEAKLDKFRPKMAVELDIDSIWDAITEDMGPAPLVEVEGESEVNPAPSNTEDQGGWNEDTAEKTTPPSTAPRKRDVQDLPEAFRSDKPEDAKEVSDSEAEKEETGFENEVTKEEEHHESSWRIDAKLADFVEEVANEIESEEELPRPRIKCDQCNLMRINGHIVHEGGCPNDGARWDAEQGDWIKQRECFECGQEVDADDPCCSAQEFDEPVEEEEIVNECMASDKTAKTADRTILPRETTRQTPGAYNYDSTMSGKALPIAQPPTSAAGAAPSWVTGSDKTADAADNDYDIDSAANPTNKEMGKSQTVECHQDYDKQQSKGAAKKKAYPDHGAGCECASCMSRYKDVNYGGGVDDEDEAEQEAMRKSLVRAEKSSADLSGDAAEAKAETVSPDTVDADIPQPTVSVEEAGKFSSEEEDAPNDPKGYSKRVRELEEEGLTTSDAQAAADAEFAKKGADKTALHFMNEYDVDEAVALLGNDPVLGKAVRFLRDFKDEVNGHSDGWAYWRQPVAAAGQLMTLIEAGMAKKRGYGRDTDPSVVIDDKALAKALSPIKAFMTRKGLAAGMEMPKFGSQGEGWVSGDDIHIQRMNDAVKQVNEDRKSMDRQGKSSADISGDMSEAKSEVDYNKAEVADDPAATDTVNPEHFASKGECAECGGNASLDKNELCSDCRHEKAASQRHDGVPEVDVPSSEDAKQPVSDLSGVAPEASNVPAILAADSKEAAWGDDQPESAEFDFGMGDLADIVISEDVDESGN